ncbi:fimbria/pilus outer membrane usher protein [Acidisoma silvae]|uniref:Fimbrial biogenesis outer membrane usher protein n=1 Tax=Acidisoma silvae TaxID=2802396 RepID=A0A964DZV1_9PROT|nr:fimbria/pilus outer membrane usher protein [Acidisoma silvae]MCB8876870.1 fimbrial biogenesis outer membrane usher protein [Acidisoma silvae]
MARPWHKMYRWPTALVEVVILPGFVVSSASAAVVTSPSIIQIADQVPAAALASLSSAKPADLYLDVTLNGTDRGIVHFSLRGNALWISHEDMAALGFTVKGDTPDPTRLTSLKGIKVNFNRQMQTVDITAPLALLDLQTQVLDAQNSDTTTATTSPGVVLDYTLYGSRSSLGYSQFSTYTDLRAFNHWGVLESTALSQFGYGSPTETDQSVQLDTSWSSSFPKSLLTLRLGDTLTAATSWSRATRIGGIQFGTNFNLQPYMVTTPLAQFVGSATLPSTVQLYIDGIQRYTGNVAAGQFQLNSVPDISGAGNAQIVLTNALGQVSEDQFSLYSAPEMLRSGLSDWSVELGAVRENYGLDSFDYGKEPVASETWRYGINNNVTAESHAEAATGLIDAGFGGDLLLGKSDGILTASAAGSSNHGASGLQVGAGYSWSGRRFDVSFNGLYSTDHYSDVATLYGAPPPTLTATATAGVNLGRIGNVGVNYVNLRQQPEPADSYAGLYWSKSLTSKVSVNVNASQNLAQQSDRSIFLSLNISLSNSTYASADVANDQGANSFGINAGKSVPTQGGLGWQVEQEHNSTGTSALGELDYLGRYGEIDAGASDVDGQETGYVGATGSLVLIGGHSFAARNINGGFAVVSTDGIANIPVKLQNNVVGTTDASGMLLVTPLNAYQKNQISIDPMNLPADMDVSRVDAVAIPSDRAGTMVQFGITHIRAASIILVDHAGKALPLGSLVRLKGADAQPTLVGFDGMTYLDDLTSHNVLDVTTPAGLCQVSFDYHNKTSTIPQIGPLTCAPIAQP